MIVGCIGDVHGRACHALAVLAKWQTLRGRKFDLVVQVGDLGVLPDPATGERPYDRFSEWDIAVYDLYELVKATGEDAKLLGEFGQEIASPIHVVPGNHDAFAQFFETREANERCPVPIDPHGLFHCVPDGYTVRCDDAVVGFCAGGDPQRLGQDYSGPLDLFVSHEGGFGEAAGEDLPEGPEPVIRYLKSNKPLFHVFGHFHHPAGPIKVHETRCVQLASVVSNPRHPTLQVINEGCIGALDTETGDFEFVEGDWLGAYGRQGGFPLLAETLREIRP